MWEVLRLLAIGAADLHYVDLLCLHALILVLPDYPQFSLLYTFGICMLHSTATINFMRGSPPPPLPPYIFTSVKGLDACL